MFSRCRYFLLLLAGLASAQTITPDKTQILFAVPVGGGTQSQLLNVTSQGGSVLVNFALNTFGTGNWLHVSPSIAATPATAVVNIDATQLPQGVYSGAILISINGSSSGPISIPVTLNVGSATVSALTASPTSLVFTGQAAGLGLTAQSLNVSSNPSGLGFAAAASTNDGYFWLQVTPSGAATAPTLLSVSVNSAGIPAGTYTGRITLTPSTGPPLIVPVTLNLSSGTAVTTNVSALQFYYQVGSFLPPSQGFTVSSGGTPLSLGISASTNDGRGWLSAQPLIGTTPQNITVSAAANGLPVGVYTGNVHVSAPTSATGGLDVPVTLTVSNGPLLTLGATPTAFVYQTGSAAPAMQTVPLASSTGTLNFTVTTNTSDGTNWLAVSPASGTTPQNLSIGVSPGSLAPGNYTGTVTVSASGASNSPVNIPISLTVSSTSTLTLSAQSVTLNFQIGGINELLSQTILVQSTGQPVQLTASPTTTSCGANWLQVSAGSFTTPTFLRITADPSGMNLPQICTGVIVLNQAGATTPIQIPVTLNVSSTPLFNITPLSLNFSAPFQGDATGAQTINLSLTDNSAVSFTAAASTNAGGGWLHVTPTGGSTPGVLNVTADPNGLSSGTYSGAITVSSPSLLATQSIPVTFNVIPTATATATPAALSFTQTAGGAAPAAQNVTLSSTGGSLSFAATIFPGTMGGGVISLNRVSGTTPTVLTVAVNGSNLAPGMYSGSVVLTLPGAGNNPLTIPITLTITPVVPVPTISAAPTSLVFSYTRGQTLPTSRTLSVTLSGGATNVSAAASGGSWLSVTPDSSTASSVFTVAANPAGLAPGSYNGTITLTSPGAAGSPLGIPVRFDVLGALAPSIAELSNAASGVRGAISPGEIVTIKGDLLGPATGLPLVLTPQGNVDVSVGGTRVFFDEVAAPILYTSAQQINAIVPYEVANRRLVQVTVEFQGTRSDALTIQTAASAPGIFTATQTGRGQGAILNSDNSYNGPNIPAAPGSIIQVFATGEGLVLPALVTGSVTHGTHLPAGKVTATIGGALADVVFAGAAPEAVAGLFQINIRVPQGLPSGASAISVMVGGTPSQTGVTVALR